MTLPRFGLRPSLRMPLLAKELSELAARKRTYALRVLYALFLFGGFVLHLWTLLPAGGDAPGPDPGPAAIPVRAGPPPSNPPGPPRPPMAGVFVPFAAETSIVPRTAMSPVVRR